MSALSWMAIGAAVMIPAAMSALGTNTPAAIGAATTLTIACIALGAAAILN